MVFATWFLSSMILKSIQKSKTSFSVNNKSITEKIKYGNDSMSYAKESPSIARIPGRTYTPSGAVSFQKPSSNPFGAKLNFKDNSNPFDPKLNLRRSHSWRFKRERETYQQENQYQQSNSSQKTGSSKSSSPVISAYQDYIDILNDQMKD